MAKVIYCCDFFDTRYTSALVCDISGNSCDCELWAPHSFVVSVLHDVGHLEFIRLTCQLARKYCNFG